MTWARLMPVWVYTSVAVLMSACTALPLRQPDAEIAAYLRQHTPLGSSHAQVLAYLHGLGVTPQPAWRGRIKPGSFYPPSTQGGASFINSHIGEYRLIFATNVEAFYIFNDTEQLREITIRRSTDAF